MMIYLILAVFFILLFGLFDGAQTARKDYPADSIFWKHTKDDYRKITSILGDVVRQQVMNGHTVHGVKYTKYDLWFLGGNVWYDPRYPWSSDFWHTMKFGWQFCISGIALFSFLAGMHMDSIYYMGALLFAYGIEGYAFRISYKWLFRKDRKPFKEYWWKLIIGENTDDYKRK